MSRQWTYPKRQTIDPSFPPPAGTERFFEYNEESIVNQNADLEEDEIIEEEDDITEGEELDDEDEDEIDAPDTFVVVEQILRRAPGGQLLVDLIIEVEDVPEADRYDIRTTI